RATATTTAPAAPTPTVARGDASPACAPRPRAARRAPTARRAAPTATALPGSARTHNASRRGARTALPSAVRAPRAAPIRIVVRRTAWPRSASHRPVHPSALREARAAATRTAGRRTCAWADAASNEAQAAERERGGGSAGQQSTRDVDPDVARDARDEASPPAGERTEHDAVEGEAQRDRESLLAVG